MTPGEGEPKRLADFQLGDSKMVFFTYVTSSKDVVLISEFH